MKKLFCAGLVALAVSCGRLGQAPKPNQIQTTDVSSATGGDREFTIKLYGVLGKNPGNVFYSPASIRMALTMAWAGARGDTANELRSALSLKGQPPELHIANAALIHAWTKPPPGSKKEAFSLTLAQGFFAQRERQFAQEYVELLSHRYDAPLSPKDFSAADTSRNEINSWVEKRTEGRIHDLLAPGSVESDTQLLLVSAVYFKAAWQRPFEPSKTAPGEFKKSDGKTVKAEMMTQNASFPYADTSEAQVLELPYVGEGFVMDVILPKGDIVAFESALSESKLEQTLAGLEPREVNVVLPKWETATRFDLKETLKKLGVHAAFKKGEADFSGMDGSRNIFVAAVVHQAFVKVDEQSTEAAAATATAAGALSPPAGPGVFRADHPFVYLIRDKKRNAVLAFGRVADPTAG